VVSSSLIGRSLEIPLGAGTVHFVRGCGCSVVDTWGSTAEERAAAYPCDGLIEGPHNALFRAVDVDAPAELVFRWLCQMRVAPYSYDLIDNLGRSSPRHLTPGLDQLEVGQQFMIFRLVAFEDGRSITLDSNTKLFGRVVGTYLICLTGSESCRLVVKLGIATPQHLFGSLRQRLLAAGDLLMMRKQLLTFKARAERDAASSRARIATGL
jgi:hypothetical protein